LPFKYLTDLSDPCRRPTAQSLHWLQKTQVVLWARIPELIDIRISHAIFLMLLAEIMGTFKAFTYEHSCEKQRIDSGTEGLGFELFSHDRRSMSRFYLCRLACG
jgi:hypothetical protein